MDGCICIYDNGLHVSQKVWSSFFFLLPQMKALLFDAVLLPDSSALYKLFPLFMLK